MLKIIRDLLVKIINDIDTGNSNINEEECSLLIEHLSEFTNKNEN